MGKIRMCFQRNINGARKRMNLISSPLRYPGGKSCLTKHFSDLIKLNRLNNITYVEPFAGGAGAALNLLFLEYVNSIWINDADYNIYSFWSSILNQTDDFIKLISSTSINLKNWHYYKTIVQNNKMYDVLEVGFATFFLNRCNHSGIINARPIGGLKQSGNWKIDARFNKANLIKRIERISYYKDRIILSNKDAYSLLPEFNNSDYLIYFDPPYFNKGKELYLNYYRPKDHVRLAEYINNKLISKWILSYDNVQSILDLYQDNKHIFFNINYSANKPKQGNEVIFYSNNLQIPSFTR